MSIIGETNDAFDTNCLVELDHSSFSVLTSAMSLHQPGVFRFQDCQAGLGLPWRMEGYGRGNGIFEILTIFLGLAADDPASFRAEAHRHRRFKFTECGPGGLYCDDSTLLTRYPWKVLFVGNISPTDTLKRADRRRDKGLADIFG